MFSFSFLFPLYTSESSFCLSSSTSIASHFTQFSAVILPPVCLYLVIFVFPKLFVPFKISFALCLHPLFEIFSFGLFDLVEFWILIWIICVWCTYFIDFDLFPSSLSLSLSLSLFLAIHAFVLLSVYLIRFRCSYFPFVYFLFSSLYFDWAYAFHLEPLNPIVFGSRFQELNTLRRCNHYILYTVQHLYGNSILVFHSIRIGNVKFGPIYTAIHSFHSFCNAQYNSVCFGLCVSSDYNSLTLTNDF